MKSKSSERKLIRFIFILIALLLSCIVLLAVSERGRAGEISVIVSPDTVSPADTPDEPLPEPEPDCATLMFGGDVLIHSTVYSQAKNRDYSYDFRPYFQHFNNVFTADYNCINLESPVDAYGGNENISSYPCFNAPHEILDSIREMNVQLCSNCNNHMLDMGYNGLAATRTLLKNSGFDALGTYLSPDEHDALFIKVINGIKIGFCAYTQTTNGLKLSDELEEYAFDRMSTSAEKACGQILPRVASLRNAGAEVVVVILHWGTEYDQKPSSEQQKTAQLLCEGGADMIIGSHPHVVQPIELLDVTREDGSQHKCLVVYSLGNLFCNQNMNRTMTQRGMVAAVKLTRSDSGDVTLADSFYMPTLLYKTGLQGADFIRLVPAGCVMSGSVPEMPAPDDFADCCALAWESVTADAGDAIPAVADPSHYPDGFFS